MHRIKAVVFGLRNLLVEEVSGQEHGGRLDHKYVDEFGRLVKFLRLRGIEPVLFANDPWTLAKGNKPAEDLLREKWGHFPAFFARRDGMPPKPNAGSMAALLDKIGLTANEVLYIGNSERDMQTAVNGNVLFLNGTWMKDAVNYGFKFGTVGEVAKFVDVFCVREHSWHFKIERDNLRFYALAPFATYDIYAQYKGYSEEARALAKHGYGDAEFWGKYLCATMLLSGIHSDAKYACPYPSSGAGTWQDRIKESIIPFTKCFRISYVPDLLMRHTNAPKSHENRATASHLRQLNTINLNPKPLNTKSGEPYRSFPVGSGKTVVIVDDICTSGYSLEAARTYIENTGAKVILVSWLKTVTKPYEQIANTKQFNARKATTWVAGDLKQTQVPYYKTITDDEACVELGKKLALYKSWDWPGGC